MSKSNHKIALPKRISETGTERVVLKRINKRSNLKLVGKVKNVLGKEFKKLEDSFLAPVIKMGRRQKHMAFSRHLIHHLLVRRIDIGKKSLWFSFGEQLMRFSLREFHLATGLPCVVDKDEEEKNPWMNKNQTLNTLLKLLVEKSTELTADQRLRLGATILVEGILMASNPVTSIPEMRLLRVRNFKEFCNFTYKKLTEKDQYAICGTFFGIRHDEFQFPLCLHRKETKSLSIEEVNRFDQMEQVDVKCILGDPELHSDLVEDVDCEFGRVVDLVKRGYRLKRQYWLNVSVDNAVAEAEVDENNYVPGIDATYHEKIEFLTKKVVSLEEKETEKSKETEAATKTNVNGQNADYELDETEVLQNYIDAKRQKIAKGKKNGVRPQREVDHLEEDDTEVEHGDKERDTSKEQPQEEEEQEVDVDDGDKESENSETNEGHTQEEEEQQQEDDTEVNADVDVGAKESENPKTNEDGEVNEDASKKPVKGTKKRGRGTKDGEVNEDASKKPVKGTKKRGRGTKGMKKGVTPPREVQQQVEDDAEVDVGAKEIENPETNEDGEVNDDASKKPVKGTKKRGRGTKGMKKGVTPPREVQQQVEDDAEVDVGAKEIENPETNEDGEVNEDASKKPVKGTKKRGRGTKINISLCIMGMKKGATPPREVQQQVEDDAEVDVGAKEIENPETNEDGEVNEDASKKPVKGTKKRGRGTKGMKKGVTPPREVQQQVKDDAEVDAKESENPKTNEDEEVNEDASKKHVKFTKKRGRVTKEPNVDTSKSKRQKKQEDSATDAIGCVWEDLKKAD
ncbi:hypothetical protein Bca52824_054346 [Brassica carinata]|uniref:DUF1985 domain-containing protein n=1 Tax=Brassica carinata TaxID=52824 RepID=A0A8X7UML8_BRACI|nr:hypothetical protein Bca52824_054346 [Brassica carinata]